MKHSLNLFFATLVICLSPSIAFSQPAFPGAEGFGANAVGGRGGTVYEVTNLNDSGHGSLRSAVEARGPRIVVFRVSGTIALKRTLTIINPYITIAGQTAPGGGICLKDNELQIEADHVIVRHIRCRAGDNVSNENHGINVVAGKNIIIDHCSTSWAVDETFSVTTHGQLDNVTVQWCFITESLHNSVHWKGRHGMGSLINGAWGNKYNFHHNLYAHHNNRNPSMGNYNSYDVDPDGLIFDFRNNVIYNWGSSPAGHAAGNYGKTEMNLVNNYYKSGPNSRGKYIWHGEVTQCRAYINSNCMNGVYPEDPWSLVVFRRNFSEEQKAAFKLSKPIQVAPVKTDDAIRAYERVLVYGGATLPQRDEVDARIVNQVINGTGRIIDDEDEVCGWPELKQGTPPKDSDHDGMPDEWEIEKGLNPNDGSDANGTNLSPEVYTNIEVYINGLVDNSVHGSNLRSTSADNATVPTPMFSAFTSIKHPSKSGWKIGKLVYYEDFNDLTDWRAEGNLTATAQDGQLLIECGARNEDRGNVWSVREFQSPFYFEFQFKKLSGRSGLNLIFWNARTVDGSDFFSIPRGWIMKDVIDGNMESYHVSYCRGRSGITNFHKNPNFHDLVQNVPDPLANPGTDWHTVGVYQNGGHIMFFEDDRLVHDVDEELDFQSHVCLQKGAHKSWNIKNELGTLCPGLDAKKVYTNEGNATCFTGRKYTFIKPNPGNTYVYTSGRIGFRHQNGVTFYDNLRVWTLVPPKDKTK